MGFDRIPSGHLVQKNDVVLTSMRRDYVAPTLIRHHFGTKCPLGLVPYSFFSAYCECAFH